MNTQKLVISLAAVLGVVVLLQNTQVVTLRFLFWRISMSQIILLVLLSALGFLAGYFWAKGGR